MHRFLLIASVLALVPMLSSCARVDTSHAGSSETLTTGVANWPDSIAGDALIDALYKPFEINISDRFFTPVIKARVVEASENRTLLSGMPYYCAAHFGRSPLSSDHELSGDTWRTVIPDAPLVTYKGPCPLCGKSFGGVTANLDASHTGKARCCGAVLYSDRADIPTDDPIAYTETLELPYMDGTVRVFHYPATDNDQKFFPAGLIATDIHSRLFYNVIPRLTLQVLRDDDRQAAAALAGILDREADIFGRLPWIDLKKTGELGFATQGDIPAMLPSTATEVAESFGEPSAQFLTGQDYQRLNDVLLEAPIGHFSASIKPNIMVVGREWRTTRQGTLAEAWDAISQLEETGHYSRKRYGESDTLRERVVAMLRIQAAYVRHNKLQHGNYVISEFAGSVPLAVLTKDEPMAQNITRSMFGHLHNHYFSEGVSHEGAFNYSKMMSQAFDPIVAKEAFGVDFTERFPWVENIYRNWDFPVVTLLNIESTHGDEHAGFFSSRKLPPPESVNYEAHEQSQVFSEYGITCLRAGEPGSRLEAIMTHQNSIMHTDPDRLALQLFYEGINLFPDIGYMTRGSNVKKAKAEIADSAFEYLPAASKGRYDYNDSAEAHCNALINGNQWGLHSATFERFLGGQDKDEAGYLSQFIQVDGTPVYAKHIEPVSTYSRQLLTVNFTNGRPVLFDAFRLHGGQRHAFFWHVPATMPHSSLGDPEELDEENLHDYFSKYAEPKPGWQKWEDSFMHFYRDKKMPYKDDVLKLLVDPVTWQPHGDSVWRIDWHVDPSRYALKTHSENQSMAAWHRFQQPVTLRLWGVPEASPAYKETLLGAMGPWGSGLPGFDELQLDRALSYLVEHRQGTNDLRSTFVHVLEPYTSKQSPTVKGVERLNASADTDGRGVKITSTDGEVAYVATTLQDPIFKDDNLQVAMTGRAGVVLPQSVSLALYDGTALRAEGVTLEMDDSYTAKLVGLRGDLTAETTESSLFVESDRAIPTNGVLNGHTLNVLHQSGKAHTSGYQIEHIALLPDKGNQLDDSQSPTFMYRIDLAGNPRFAQYKYRVSKLDEDDPTKMTVNWETIVGVKQSYLIGRKAYFPRSGFSTSVANTGASGYRDYYTKKWFMADHLPADAVKVGDPVIIYAIQPNDTVLIPSFFACRPSADGSTFMIQSSGNATLTIPPDVAFKNVPRGIVVGKGDDGVKLTIEPGDYRLTQE